MKKLIGSILAIFAMASFAQAANLVYSGVMVSTNGPASSTAAASSATYTMDVNASGGDLIGAQLNYSSAVISSFTFTDGSVSTFTLTVVSTQGIVGVPATDTITVSTNSALNANNTSAIVSISSNSSTAINGSSLTITTNDHVIVINGGIDFTVGASSNATAQSLAGAINYAGIGDFTAALTSVGGSSVTIKSTRTKAKLNNWTVISSTIAISTTAFSGGADSASFTLNGANYLNGSQWKVDVNFSSNTAVSIENSINVSGGYGVIATTTSANVIKLTALSSGTYGNAFTLSASTGALTIGSPTFTGGQNAGTFSINGTPLTAGVDYSVGASASATATNIATALNANSILSPLIAAAAANAVVFTTANFVGAPYAITTSTQSALTISPFISSSPVTGIASGLMSGGLAASYTIQTPTITVTNNGLTTGFAVLYTTSSSVALAPLVPNTTYFAIRIDANRFALATSLANAQAGTFITLTSSQTKTSSDTFTIAPTALSGNAVFQLQASNDGVNWGSITTGENGTSLSNVTFSTPYTTGSTLWDIGKFDHRWLRLSYLGPTFGGVNFAFYVNQKIASTAR